MIGGNYSNLGDGVFLAPFDPSSGTEDNTDMPVSSGTASKLVVRLPAALGAATATVTLRKNGVDTALACTIPAASSSCMDLVHSVSFVDGDMLSLRYNETSTPNTRVKFSILYQAP